MASVEGTRQESMEQLGQSSKENASLKTELQKTWHENQAMAQEVKSEMLHISLIFLFIFCLLHGASAIHSATLTQCFISIGVVLNFQLTQVVGTLGKIRYR